jgi:hypothetical protein
MEAQNSLGAGYRAFQAIWDGQNGDKLREMFSDCFEFHNLDGRNDVTDLRGLRERMAALRAAHPGARLHVQNAVGSGSHIAFDWTLGDPTSQAGRAHGGTFERTFRDGSCMIRLNGECVEELWELNGALTA